MTTKFSSWLLTAKRLMLGIVAIALVVCSVPLQARAARPPMKKATKRHVVRHRRVRYRRYRRHRIVLPRAPSKDRTEEIQSALGRGGYYKIEPNGKWDARTQQALREFQEANGLPPTGKLDAISLQKLGLGSDVAGVSAPRQSTATNRLVPSASSSTKLPGGR